MTRHVEDAVQIAILNYLALALPNALVHHSPNGGSRKGGVIEGARFKRLGVRAGFPDLVIFPGDGRCFVIEVKAPKVPGLSAGRVSVEQRELMDRLHHLGVQGAVCYSVTDAELALRAWGLLRK